MDVCYTQKNWGITKQEDGSRGVSEAIYKISALWRERASSYDFSPPGFSRRRRILINESLTKKRDSNLIILCSTGVSHVSWKFWQCFFFATFWDLLSSPHIVSNALREGFSFYPGSHAPPCLQPQNPSLMLPQIERFLMGLIPSVFYCLCWTASKMAPNHPQLFTYVCVRVGWTLESKLDLVTCC